MIEPAPAPAVLHVNRVGFLGGVERVILTLAVGLQRHGFDAKLACPDGELARAAVASDVAVTLCNFTRMRAAGNPFVFCTYPLRWLIGASQVLAACRRHDVQLIHAHHPVGALYAAWAQRRLRVPLILHIHEVLPAHWFYRLALRRAARHVSRFVCVSEAGRALLETVLGRAAGRADLVHNGIPAAFVSKSLRPLPDVEGRPGPHIGVFGVLEPRKGQDVFLEAAARIALVHPEAHFWIVGAIALKDKAGFAKRLLKRAEQPPLRGRVHFTGFQDNVGDWMAAMDVVALASVSHESLSMVLLEAVTLGRPTVGTSVGGGAEIIRDGETGRVVPPGDAAALAAAITDMLTPAGAACGCRAAKDARRRFAGEVFCERIADIYRDLLGIAGGD